jgi:hypothetical protein
MNNQRINQIGSRDQRQTERSPNSRETVAGRWRGESITLSATDDVDDTLATERLAREIGISAPPTAKQLSQLKISLEQKSSALTSSDIADYTDAVGSNARTSKLAKSYLNHFTGNGPKPRPGPGTGELMRDYLALQKLAAALRGSGDDFVALLTPLKDRASTLDELAEKLQQAGEDSEKTADILSEVEGLPKNNESLYQMMKTLRFDEKKLKQKLHESQKLPELSDEDKKALLERVEDELRERERSINALGSARESGNAETFIDGYNDLVLASDGFSGALSKLLEHYKPAELRNIIPLMKQALADDLNADPRSSDKTKLEILLSDISNMHISATLLEMTAQLVSGLQRIYGGISSQPA